MHRFGVQQAAVQGHATQHPFEHGQHLTQHIHSQRSIHVVPCMSAYIHSHICVFGSIFLMPRCSEQAWRKAAKEEPCKLGKPPTTLPDFPHSKLFISGPQRGETRAGEGRAWQQWAREATTDWHSKRTQKKTTQHTSTAQREGIAACQSVRWCFWSCCSGWRGPGLPLRPRCL